MDRHAPGSGKGQAAIDFLVSYGIVLIALAITIIILFKISIGNSYTSSPYCNPSPGFSCGFFTINAFSGVLNVQIDQATGGPITVSGLACSSDLNASGNLPEFGNVQVTANSVYYPQGGFVQNTLYSGSAKTFTLYCYGSGGIATGQLGNAFTGYVWMNYTIPNYGQRTQLIATVNAKYT